jgi:tellurite resistance protein
MPEPNDESIEAQFGQAIRECEALYLSAAHECCARDPTLDAGAAEKFVERMNDLHRGLLVKIFAGVAEADRRWTAAETGLAAILLEHLWQETLEGERLREAIEHLGTQAHRLKWYSLVRPFDQIPMLRERVGELETVVLRVANLVAKCDGVVTAGEAALLQTIEEEIAFQLRPLSIDDDPSAGRDEQAVAAAVEPPRATTPQSGHDVRRPQPPGGRPLGQTPPAAEKLADVLRELNQLVGIEGVKHEIVTLTNYLQLQQQRRAAGLPDTNLSLHMVFSGNPGTGKTTVARLVARIFRAMGILRSGHLVETDRSGLVAEYAGQTGPKTNQRIDEALHGVLFIDEAYSLTAAEGDDAYGREAVQTLLKRMEDDRERLVVILAGYTQPMQALLSSNPGLSSRFNTQLSFADYQPSELGRIFELLCEKNHYQLPAAVRAKLLLGLDWYYEHRDGQFGNGRLVRNLFEQTIRGMANRIAHLVPVTKELLTRFDAADLDLPEVPPEVLARATDSRQRFLVVCPGCRGKSRIPAAYLGLLVQCKGCQHRFPAAWGEAIDLADEP